MAERSELDVLVVGAGPTGLTVAGQLRAMGSAVRIVDRQADRVHESRALAMQPRTLEVLRGLGVTAQLVDEGNRAMEVELRSGRRRSRISLFDVGVEDTAFPFLLFLSQAKTERILIDHLEERGVHVERRVELVSFEDGVENATCVLRHPDGRTERLRARFVVGCDGAHSTVRHHARIPFVGGGYAQTFALGDVEADGDLQTGVAYAYLAPSGILFFFPLGSPTAWRVIGELSRSKRPRPGIDDRPLDLSDLQCLVDSFTDRSVRVRDPAWLTSFGLHHRQAAHYRRGRAFLAGDAAHVHSPAGAQGMNTGIQDAWNLGWKLALVASGVANPALLDTYHAERWPIGRFVLRFSDRAFRAATSVNPLVGLLRTHVAPTLLSLAARSPAARVRAFRAFAELTVNYRRSPAVEEGQPVLHDGPRAGDRLPDARVLRAEREVWLQEAVAAPRFHLLLCGPRDPWPEERLTELRRRYDAIMSVHRLTRDAGNRSLRDASGEVLARLGVETTGVYLIRPDGYVSFRAAGPDLQRLDPYLERWIPRGARI
jgi:2-polyprenyl-6-methoxyphenol hydroxylase-like FAD-dependent oxidoreductase